MERQGSGFKKITEAYHFAHNYHAELEPKFYSDAVSFHVTLYNLNYNIPIEEAEKQFVDTPQTAHWTKKQSVEQSIHGLIASNSTKDKLFRLFKEFEFDEPFSRADIVEMFGITTTPANELLRKLKKAKLIESVKGMGKGKYKFIEPLE